MKPTVSPVPGHTIDPPLTAVRVTGEPSPLVRHVAEVLCHSGLAVAGDETAHGLLEVRVRAGRGEAVELPSTPPVSRHLDIGVWRCGERLVLDDGRSRLELSPGEGLVAAELAPELAASEVWARCNLILLYGVLTVLRFRGVFALHAAAVARGGVGCLLVASSGSGKSTAALGLMRQGWSFVSDDSVLLESLGDAVVAYPLRRDVFLKGVEAPAAGERWQSLRVGGREVHRLTVSECYPDRVAAVCVPRLLLFPVVCDRAVSRLVPLGRPQALGQLLHQSTIVDLEPSMARPHVDLLRDLVAQCRVYQLEAGRDVLDDPGRLSSMLKAEVAVVLGSAGSPSPTPLETASGQG